MNARALSPPDAGSLGADGPTLLFASADVTRARWLANALAGVARVETVEADPAQVTKQVSQIGPALVLIDFAGARAAAASAIAATAHLQYPGLPLVAVGSLAEPESALAALRAGVRDFIDTNAPAPEARRVVRDVLDNALGAMPGGDAMQRNGRVTALLGARAGMGVTTLAANLGVLLAQQARRPQSALLDLGLPASDGAMLLNVETHFSFVEAVRNLRRFDHTLVSTALARHASGLALTSLPVKLGEMREVSYASAVALLNRLRSFFDQQLVDLGGFANEEFVSQLVHVADETWVVCDQYVASVVSTVALLDALRALGLDVSTVRLIVNRHDSECDLSAEQIAARVGVELLTTLPDRRIALYQAANGGRVLAQSAPRDPYVRAVDALAQRLMGETEVAAAAAGGVSKLKQLWSSTLKRI